MCTCANPSAVRPGPGRTTVRQVKRLSRDRKSISDPSLETRPPYPPCTTQRTNTNQYCVTPGLYVSTEKRCRVVCSQGFRDRPSRCLHRNRQKARRTIDKIRLDRRRTGCLRIRCTASPRRCPGRATRSTRIPVNFR